MFAFTSNATMFIVVVLVDMIRFGSLDLVATKSAMLLWQEQHFD